MRNKQSVKARKIDKRISGIRIFTAHGVQKCPKRTAFQKSSLGFLFGINSTMSPFEGSVVLT